MPVSQAPDQILQQALQGQVPEIKPYEALTELNSRVKSKQAVMAMVGNNAIAQAQQMRQQPPIAAQVMQANNALNRGIGGLPVPESRAFSGGGIVAFQDGGIIPAPRESLGGGSYLYQLAQNHGIVLSPYDRPEEREEKIKRLQRLKAIGEWALTNSARIPNEYAPGPPGLPSPAQVAQPTTPEIPIPEISVAEVKAPFRASAAPAAPAAPVAPAARKDYKYAIPKIEAPTARTIEELEAELTGRVDPRMSEYDKRMEKYRQRAAAMERGEGIKTPSRLDRGIGGFMAGAADEVAAARRAGVRPSLGMALAGAARSARAEDKEREKLRRDMEEKGMQLNMLMDQRREAYEAGQYERANALSQAAKKTESEALAARNRMAEYEATAKNKETDWSREDTKDAADRDFKERELIQRAQLTREQIASAQKVAGMRAAGGAGGSAEDRARLAAMKASPAWVALDTQAKTVAKQLGTLAPGKVRDNEMRKLQPILQQMATMYQAFGIAPQNDPDFVALTSMFGSAPASGQRVIDFMSIGN